MIANTAESPKGGKMSAFETATKFFHACESLESWDGCKDYVAAGTPFSAQCEPLVDIHTVEAYCEWMADLGNGPLKRRPPARVIIAVARSRIWKMSAT